MTSSFTDSIQALDQQLIQLVYRSRSLIHFFRYLTKPIVVEEFMATLDLALRLNNE